MPNAPYVVDLPKNTREKLRLDLEDQGFTFSSPPHTDFQAKKKGIVCTLYTSGRLVVQGSESEAFILYYLEPEITKSFLRGNESLLVDRTPRIGVDEAGKGDFFGPLCIAAVYAGNESIDRLLQIGVKDSKKMTDDAIKKMAATIRATVPHQIVRIGPAKYNELYEKFPNLNYFLAWGHATAIESLSKATGCLSAHIDQFTKDPLVEKALKQKKLSIDLKKSTKGESDPVIAAASILARDSFVQGMEILSQSIGWKLPKGASSHVIEAGKKLLREKGVSIFEQIAKKHFKTLDEILKNA